MPQLIVERGREKGQSFTLQAGGENTIGRDPATAQVVISDVASSRRHFQIVARGGKWFVVDLESRNGTFVNEEKVERERELAPGDRVQVGETVFSFLEDEKAEAGKAGGLQGREIGGYAIMERIGRGGMGTVYKARQISMNRVVALKFLLPKLSSNPAFVEQFRAEARAAGQLNHPNVVQALDVFELNGLHCFSMEFMEAGCVQDLLSKREDSRLPWEEALPLLLDAVRGLVFAEKRGIIHRDIKPDNLMLTIEQKVKIGDLGLAKSAHDGEGADATGIFGTPHFIAPEQAQGKPVTHAADIYSLGATFYRMCVGKTPFTGSTVKEILRAQINDPHTPVVQQVPDFPPDLSAIIDKMMSKKVETRYQSAAKLLEDLDAFQLAHHIELAGGVKSRKPFLIAMGVLGVALAAVIYYAATREPEKEIKNTNTTVTVYREPTTVGPTEEEIQADRDRDAKSALLEIQVKEGALGPISIDPEKRKSWEDLAREYDALPAKYELARQWPSKAKARAGEIRDEIRRLERQKTEVLDKARDWWTSTENGVKTALQDRKWSEAVGRAGAALQSSEWGQYSAHVPKTAEGWLKGILTEAFNGATESLNSSQGRADERVKAGDAAGAMKLLDEWETSFKTEAGALAAAKLDDGRFGRLLEQATTWRQKKSEDLQRDLTNLLETDKNAFIAAYRAVRHWPVAADDLGGPVFVYRFGDAAAELEAALAGKLRTALYRKRAERKAAELRAMQSAWESFVRMLADRKLFAGGEEVKGFPGADSGTKLLYDADRPATLTDVFLIKSISGAGGGGAGKMQRAWADLTPSEIHRAFIAPKAEKLAPELAAGLARMFAELGEQDAAGDLFDRSKAAFGDPARFREELTAIQTYASLLREDPAKGEATIRAVQNWRDFNRRADFFVLVDGRTPPEMPHLFREDDVDRFLVNWGVLKD